MKHPLLRKLLFLLLALVLLEVVLRFAGFGQLPLYYNSQAYDYALVHSQDLERFGNRFYINAAGMRSEELLKGEKRVVKFGDSVLNGGVATDQSELASSILNEALSALSANARVLNVSAGSWGPDNAFAWLLTYGDFDASMIVLLFSSHDWQDQMEFRDVVGNVPFYPDHSPMLAIIDAVSWLFSRYAENVDWKALPMKKTALPKREAHNTGWDSFIEYCAKRKIPLLIYHHCTLDELQAGQWNQNGLALEAFLNDQNVDVISGLASAFAESDYRDNLHPNEKGQAKIAAALQPVLMKMMKDGR